MASPFIWLQHAVPQHALTRVAGRLAASRRSWIKDQMIRRFVATYDVDMGDAARGIDGFASFNDFFTRELKPGARPLGDPASQILSPADGAVSQLGTIADGRIIQAKGRDYSTEELLGHGDAVARRFDGGQFITIYLSPRDYHRVHMPTGGTLQSSVYIPGDLFSVNQQTAQGVERLFARNERLACLFAGPDSAFASVMVGAMIVAGIDTAWPHRFSGHQTAPLREDFTDNPHRFAAGDEMGRFYLGSTVVLLFEPGQIAWSGGLRAGDVVRMGQPIAQRLKI